MQTYCRWTLLIVIAVFYFTDSESVFAQIRFEDVTVESGIVFKHYSPLGPKVHTHLVMGSGLAWFDYDRDGWPDLYCCQGREWPEKPDSNKQSNQLYRNLQNGRFAEITARAGLKNFDYSMGVAAGDYNNDGFADLFISSFGKNRLYENNGDGTFTEVGGSLKLDDARYGASCTWADTDNDGFLDLFVVNYLKIDPKNYKLCTDTHGNTSYPIACHPSYIDPVYDILYRNTGAGAFQNVTQQAGLKSFPARQGLGIVAADLDKDNDIDFYVANDTVPNQLWINHGKGKFSENGLLTGAALNRSGRSEAGMGIAVGDVDGDSRFDLFVTNFFEQTNTLYRNDDIFFTDVTAEFGLAAPSKQRLAFGTNLLDADNDGWLDLFVGNGHIHPHLKQVGQNQPFEQRAQCFHNQNGKRFADVSTKSGAYFERYVVARGSAVADYNRDGLMDLAVTHLNGPATLLKNQTKPHGNSLQLELVGTKSNRSGIGAVVSVVLDNQQLTRLRNGSASYLSCDEGRLTIGIGEHQQAEKIFVRWPGGNRERWDDLQAERLYLLVEGKGTPIR